MDLSVVVVTFQSAGCLENCLAAAARHLPGCELIVVDNSSSDGSLELARRFPGVRAIDAGTNLGFGRACNLGAAAATRHHILFLNPDVMVSAADEHALEGLFAAERFGLGVPLLTEHGRTEHQVYRYGNALAQHLALLVRPLVPREISPRPRAVRDSASGWAAAPMLLVARAEFERVGGFDPRYFLYAEDRDLSRRYRAAQLPIRPTTALAGVHAQGGSSSGPALESVVWMHLGWLEYLFIWHGRRTAAAAAWLTLAVLRAELAGLGAARRLPRVAPKRAALEQVRARLLERAFEQSAASLCCADARALIRAAAER